MMPRVLACRDKLQIRWLVIEWVVIRVDLHVRNKKMIWSIKLIAEAMAKIASGNIMLFS